MATIKSANHDLRVRTDGLTGIFALLTKQHCEAGALLERATHDATKRAELWPKIRLALLTHERSEMRVLYPELRMHDALRASANSHDAEAAELERMIHDLDDVELASDVFGKLLQRLADTVVRHASEEEQDIFPRAQEAIGRDRARQLEPKFLATQKSLAESA